MRAVRVQKRGKANRGRSAVHWLTDDDGTRCGLDLDTLVIDEELDLDRLPPVEACLGCARAAGDIENTPGYDRHRAEPVWAGLHALTAPYGRASSAGPLRQHGRSGHGRTLRQ